MKKEKENSAIETILAIPKNKDLYSYKINNGSTHILKKEEMIPYVKQFIKKEDIKVVLDYLDRFRPFIIIVKEKRIIELVKNINDRDYFSNQIKEEIYEEKLIRNFRKEKKETIPNDKLFNKKIEKYFKFRV